MTDQAERALGARGEQSHVEFLGATWTTFDRYARYSALARAVRANLGPGEHRVLDVGDGSGYLAAFDPGLRPTSVDLCPSAAPLPGAIRVIGDGSRLPIRDNAFKAVVSGDVLEHVPAGGRASFLAELARVSSDLVVVAAPFDTPGVAGAEELVRRYAMLATGRPQEQLDEHAMSVLPSVHQTVDSLGQAGLEVLVQGNGNLHDWLLYMLLKFQLGSRPALTPLEAGYDLLYNLLFAARNEVGPFYRHVLVARPKSGAPAPVAGEPLGPIDNTPVDLTGLIAALVAANATEASRQDTVPRLDGLRDSVSAMQISVDTGVARLETRLAELTSKLQLIQGATDDVQYKMNRLVRVLKHPVRTAARLTRRAE